ncbi:MAG: DMT family transporter [Pseudomonadota bacterium]
MQTALLTFLALAAFAANSILCRLALKDGAIDPVSFTQIRLLAGAAFLAPFFWVRREALLPLRGANWRPAAALFVYAIAFSLSYVSLDAGVGALILFGTVQFTMIGYGVLKGERPNGAQLFGAGLAFAGLVYLLAPGLSAPPILGAGLMAIAGFAWGAYSLFGKGSGDPVGATSRNFLLCAPAALLLLLAPYEAHMQFRGIALALASGVIASGAGYVIWYRALKGLANLHAAVVQLAVPIIAGLGGVAFIGETVTVRLAVSAALVLGGIFLAIRAKSES